MKRLIILALTLTVGLSACDVLDLEPKDRVTQFDYFKTANDLELFSNPFYNNLLDKDPSTNRAICSSRTPSPPFSSAAVIAPCPNRAEDGRGRICAA